MRSDEVNLVVRGIGRWCGEKDELKLRALAVAVDANMGKEMETTLWCLRGERRGHSRL
jgi:hypothetical protein